jgi:hypothetical protein
MIWLINNNGKNKCKYSNSPHHYMKNTKIPTIDATAFTRGHKLGSLVLEAILKSNRVVVICGMQLFPSKLFITQTMNCTLRSRNICCSWNSSFQWERGLV